MSLTNCYWCLGPDDVPEPDEKLYEDEERLGPTIWNSEAREWFHNKCRKEWTQYKKERQEAFNRHGNLLWLVEEPSGSDLDGVDGVRFHSLEFAATAQEAMIRARNRGVVVGYELSFGIGELKEYVPGYWWAAADGSMVCTDVRCLGKATVHDIFGLELSQGDYTLNFEGVDDV